MSLKITGHDNYVGTRPSPRSGLHISIVREMSDLSRLHKLRETWRAPCYGWPEYQCCASSSPPGSSSLSSCPSRRHLRLAISPAYLGTLRVSTLLSCLVLPLR